MSGLFVSVRPRDENNVRSKIAVSSIISFSRSISSSHTVHHGLIGSVKARAEDGEGEEEKKVE